MLGSIAVSWMVMSQELRTFLTNLLPPTRAVRLTDVTVEPADVVLQLTTTAAAACCPRCAVPSSAVHSRYQRHLTDLPWGTRPVRIQLMVRKFACRNPSCPRRIFTERVPELAAAYARKTQRLIACVAGDRRGPWRTGGCTAHASHRMSRQSGHPVTAGASSAPPSGPAALDYWG